MEATKSPQWPQLQMKLLELERVLAYTAALTGCGDILEAVAVAGICSSRTLAEPVSAVTCCWTCRTLTVLDSSASLCCYLFLCRSW